MNMINWIKSLITEYGGINVLIMALTIILTNLIKKPIKNKADKITEFAKTILGVELDKSAITSNIVFIPIGIAFILYFGYTVIITRFDFTIIEWSALLSNSLVYGMLSVSLFDIVKAKLNAYKSKDTYEEVKHQLQQKEKEAEHDLLMAEKSEEIKIENKD